MQFHRKIIVPVLGIVFLLTFCKKPDKVLNQKILRNINVEDLCDSITDKYGDINSINAKIKVLFKNNKKSTSFNCTFKLKYDSIIWVSVTPMLGIELARLKLTKDSVTFVDKYHSTYYHGNYNGLNAMFNVSIDFNFIQSVLLNRIFYYKVDTISPFFIGKLNIQKDINYKLFKIENFEKRRKALKEEEGEGIYQALFINNYNLKTEKVLIKDFKENRKIEIDYSDYTFQQDIKTEFPEKISIKFKEKEEEFIILLEIDKISFNIEQAYPFSIPISYKPL